MKRLAGVFAIAVVAGCASSAPRELQEWKPAESAPAELVARLAPGQVYVEAAVVEVRARGLAAPRVGPLDVTSIAELIFHEGARLVQAPSIVTFIDKPAQIFVGEHVTTTDRGYVKVGQTIDFVARADGTAHVEFVLSGGDPQSSIYESARANVDFRWDRGRPTLVQVPGRSRTIEKHLFGADEVRDEERVYLLVFDVRTS